MKIKQDNKNQEIKEELVYGLVGGLVYGLVGGLVVGLTTQFTALITSNPLFSAFDFWSMLVLLIIVQGIGWYLVWRLKNEKGE